MNTETTNRTEYRVINNRLMLERLIVERGGKITYGAWRVRDNIFETVRAQVIWDAKESAANFLPRTLVYIDEDIYPDLMRWRMAFSSDNSPATVVFKGRDRELAEAIKDIDFSKPYDEDAANKIRANFTKSAARKPDVDADLIIQGELGELDA